MPKRKPKQLEFDYTEDIESLHNDKMTKKEKDHQYYEKNKEHIKARSRQYRKDNPDKKREQDRLYRENNQEKIKEYRERRYLANREEILKQQKEYRSDPIHKAKASEYQRQYRIDNEERLKEQHRIYWVENREKLLAQKVELRKKNPEKFREKARKYYAENKETIKPKRKLYSQNNPGIVNTNSKRRKHRKKNLESTLTSKEWQLILDQHFGCCHYCGKKSDDLHQEHKIPVSKGGGYTADNIVPACPECNHAKFVSDYEEFVEGTNERLQLNLL